MIAGDDAPPPDGPPLDGERYSLTWGPLTVPPLQEDTRCVTLRLSNTAPIKVRQIHNHLSGLSHHFIVYRDSAATQVAWGLDYIGDRYGSPCGAWRAFGSKGWY